MTDKELLELAAKAAGISVGKYIEPHGLMIGSTPDGPICWNPLINDGDAFRLLVKLHIDLTHCHPDSIKASFFEWYDFYGFGNDACGATRRAIVLTAAKIGKAIP